jgi:hypothetical protein
MWGRGYLRFFQGPADSVLSTLYRGRGAWEGKSSKFGIDLEAQRFKFMCDGAGEDLHILYTLHFAKTCSQPILFLLCLLLAQ